MPLYRLKMFELVNVLYINNGTLTRPYMSGKNVQNNTYFISNVYIVYCLQTLIYTCKSFKKH